ncbi:uncharacterized protein SPPG_01984 [Spizellomyces punctatus DAOM BR117]|uniref:Cyanocobalamin reductase (cyanide-eliminating) n=1 Tax=Spizellomyces punctatus (strain DAOM BR117) TaxID=645134 RepID=A0A0L0HQ19_SPIPD|nr:uncharacterized protein SPPG_01984 [Spizellomyces punctatus DAOM BR117]KND02904.1 hypothetical protein SPPG_01984 [Spizellomyces punctatus DAOM BR117]|eukprot:XP_016610943.1 hypothetical protein SPPG_01984 [Spizellomyces punctatus DAOM BR117]
MSNYKQLVKSLANALSPAGLAVSQPFPVQRYNNDPACSPYPLPTFDRSHSTLAILVYNSKSIWDPFIAYLAQDPASRLEGTSNPLDDYAAKTIESALLNTVPSKTQYLIRYPHNTGKEFVHFQRLCHLSGTAYRNPNCFLCVHPIHGPWMALRAVIVLDMDGPSPDEAFEEPTNPYPEGDEAVRERCSKLQQEVDVDAAPIAVALNRRWHELVEIRDLVGGFLGDRVGIHRYDELQLNYHYSKEKKYLREAVGQLNERQN